jgi:hypothetical protein
VDFHIANNAFNAIKSIKRIKLLEKQFVIDKDYKLLLTKPGKQSDHTRGGHNKEIFMLNVSTFKKFCLKAGTIIHPHHPLTKHT